MTTNLKEMMDAANAAVPRITPAQAQDMVAQGNTLIVDVRDALEVVKSGKIAGAVNVSRGLLEFRADPDSPLARQEFCQGEECGRLLRLRRSRGAQRQGSQRHGL
jgi:predicted sulfurtransferase